MAKRESDVGMRDEREKQEKKQEETGLSRRGRKGLDHNVNKR